MTRLAFCADVHLGNHVRFGGATVASLNRRCREGLTVLDKALQRAHELRCSEFFVLGDLFDYQRPEAQLIRAVQDILSRGGSAMRKWLLVGNHDLTSMTDGDHALGPLRPVANIVDRPTLIREDRGLEIGLVPFMPGKGAETLPATVAELWKDSSSGYTARILGIHLGVADTETPPWLKDSADCIGVGALVTTADARGIGAVFAGNWHDRRFWKGKPEVFQLGALVPTGWDNPGLDGYGTLGIWEDGEITYEEIAGPRFLKWRTGGEEIDLVKVQKTGHKAYVSLTVPRSEVADAQTWLESKVNTGRVVAGEVLPDANEAATEARTAATAASSAATLEEALAGFVAEMPLEEGIDRSDVLAGSQRYLNSAR
jgi:hypothetical protein